MLGTDWARIGGIAAICVAAFTGLTVVLQYLSNRHDRTITGYRRPFRIRSASSAMFLMVPIVVTPAEVASDAWRHHRMILVHIYNHSDSQQFFGMEPACRVVWPRGPRPRPSVVRAAYALPAHSGAVMAVVLTNGGGDWPTTKCWLWLRIVSSSAFHQRRLIRGALIDYDPRWSPQERSPGLPPIPVPPANKGP
jgi:hypothetical protein